MVDGIQRAPRVPTVSSAKPEGRGVGGPRFTLERPTEQARDRPRAPALPPALQTLERQRETIDRWIAGARTGARISPLGLLALQTEVYAYAQRVELVSRLVDRTVGAVKTVLNTQL